MAVLGRRCRVARKNGNDMTHQQASPAPELPSPKDAAARSTEAQRKASRPWFRRKRFLLPLALIVLVVVIQAAYGGSDRWPFDTAKSGSQPTVTSNAQPAPDAKIGSTVRDGTFEFVVTGIQHPGKTLAGKVGKTLTAQGEFVIVRVDVTNIGKVAQSADCRCQLLVIDKGQKLQPSPAVLSTKEALKFVTLIEPGTTVKGVLILFDVAPGTKVTHIELHDSASTQGATVKLS
jgi:hypothetical protein